MVKARSSSPWDIFEDTDPREEPIYLISEAAQYLSMPKSTLRSWVLGQSYQVGSDSRRFRPVIRIPSMRNRQLSFLNLIEAHVLSGLRRQHKISLQKIRAALRFLGRHYPSPHPLATHQFQTDGVDLFVEKYADLINASRDGQLEMSRIIRVYLQRVERDDAGIASRLFPFTRNLMDDSPRLIVIDPRVAFGKPVLLGTRIPTRVVAERYKAGEAIASLVRDYDRSQEEIEEAIRCELEAA